MKFVSCPRIRSCAAAVFSAAVFTLGLAPLLPAQNTSTSASVEGEEVVRMDVFEVKSRSEADEYMQTETTTGTRIATKIIELPFSVQSITSEFMEDFDILDLGGGDLDNMASSLSEVDGEGNFSLRGFRNTYTLRDGFYRLGLNDRTNVDRVDVIKGPSAAMYGQTTPAGMVNFISKRPKSKPETKAKFSIGNDELYQGEVSMNTPFGSSKKYLNLLTLSLGQKGSAANDYGITKSKGVFDSFTWKISQNTQLNVQAEYNKLTGTADTTATIFDNPDDSTGRTGTLSQVNRKLSNFSQRGAAAYKTREQSSFTAILDHRFNKVWSGRLGAYYYYRRAVQGPNTTGTVHNSDANGAYIIRLTNAGSNTTATKGSETNSRRIESGAAIQSDITARYNLFGGKIKAASLLMIDFNTNRRQVLQHRMSAERYNQIRLGTNNLFTGAGVYVDDPDYLYYVPDDFDYTQVSRDDDTKYYDIGFFLRQQITALNDRLRAFGGLRYDFMDFNQNFRDRYNNSGVLNEGYINKTHAHAWSPCIGVNYQLTKQIAVYANYSESFTPNAQNTTHGDINLPNETGEGWDYGVKTSFFNERLYLSAGGFYVIRDGVKISSSDSPDSENPDYMAGGKHVAKGLEIDFNWRITDSLQLLGGYGYVNTSVVEYPGNTTDIIGRHTEDVPRDNGFLAIKYKFPEPLKGLSLNVKLSYTGRSNPNSNQTGSNSSVAYRDWETPSYALLNIGVSYGFSTRAFTRVKHTLRLTVKNVGDREYIDYRGSYKGTGRTLLGSYAVSF